MADDGKSDAGDVVFLHRATDDGQGVKVVRARDGKVELGEVRPLEDGKPVTGDIVTLKPRAEQPRLCDVKVEYASTDAAAPRKPDSGKPAQVASARYRENWEAIFSADARGAAPSDKSAIGRKGLPN
jgi:hypothetical protein